MERYTWKTNGKKVTCYVVNGKSFVGQACHMKALAEWGKSHPHIRRDKPFVIVEDPVDSKLKVLERKIIKVTKVKSKKHLDELLSTASLAQKRKQIKSDFE